MGQVAEPFRLQDFLHSLEREKAALVRDYGIRDIGIFGSVVRGEAKSDSDVDVLVDFDKPVSLFRFVRLQNHLSSLWGGRRVDLVMKSSLKPRIGQRILEEVRRP